MKRRGRHPEKALNAVQVRALKEPGRYTDGNGLYLVVDPSGAKRWVLRTVVHGRRRDIGLGGAQLVSLAEAREKATSYRKLARAGGDPLAEKRSAERIVPTFRDAAQNYIGAHETGWRNPKHRAQWKSTLATYSNPTLGNLSIASIDTALVLKCLKPIWTEKPETASRVRGRIEAILDWAAANGYRQGENPARWKGHLDKLLPARAKLREIRHHPALSYAELPAFMLELVAREGVSARALEVTILTALRTGSVIGARWSELELTERIWTVPRERMKWQRGQTPRDHRVPLSDRVIEILEAIPREEGNEYVFLGDKPGKPISNMAMLELLRGMRAGVTVHGFRSTFKDWASETTSFPEMVVEMALAHVVGDKVEAAYRRGDLFQKRRKLMYSWAAYVLSVPSKVVGLRTKRI